MTVDDLRSVLGSLWTASDIAALIRGRQATAEAVLEFSLDRIRRDEGLNAFVAIDETLARRDARAVDACIRDGLEPGPLAGVPIGVKDFEEEVAGFRTTAGSHLLKSRPVATSDTPHVARLRAAGAVIVGRTASAEFAMASDTHTAAYGTTRNPWNRGLTPGGSSGGSAASVAAGLVPLATGSDSGGSIRSPASHCGLVGLKPTFGRIPQPVPGSTLNAVGILAKTVRDVALHLDVASGPHASDRFSLPRETAPSYISQLIAPSVAGARVVVSLDLGYNPVDPAIAATVQNAAGRLIAAAQLKLVRREVAFANVYLAYVLTVLDELRHVLAVEHGSELSALTPSLADALARTADLPASLGYTARRAAAQIERQACDLFEAADFIITPVTTALPHAACGPSPHTIAGVDAESFGVENFPMWANYTGCPSISLPAGRTAEGLPVGLLVTAPRLGEDRLLQLAAVWEAAAPWPLDVYAAGALT